MRAVFAACGVLLLAVPCPSGGGVQDVHDRRDDAECTHSQGLDHIGIGVRGVPVRACQSVPVSACQYISPYASSAAQEPGSLPAKAC